METDNQSPLVVDRPVFVINVLIGMLESMDDLKSLIWGRGIHVAEPAMELLNRIELSKTKRVVRVAVMTVRHLGLERGGVRDEVYEAGKRQGFKLMTPEFAVLLRINYTDQPRLEWAYAAMMPLRKANGRECVLSLGRRDIVHRADALILGASDGDENTFWHAGRHVIFAMDE